MSDQIDPSDVLAQLMALLHRKSRADADGKVNTALYERALAAYSELAFDPAATPEALATAREEIHVAMDRVLDDASIITRLVKEVQELTEKLEAAKRRYGGDE